MNTNRIRVTSPTIVARIAAANGTAHTSSPLAASVNLRGVVYFWSAA